MDISNELLFAQMELDKMYKYNNDSVKGLFRVQVIDEDQKLNVTNTTIGFKIKDDELYERFKLLAISNKLDKFIFNDADKSVKVDQYTFFNIVCCISDDILSELYTAKVHPQKRKMSEEELILRIQEYFIVTSKFLKKCENKNRFYQNYKAVTLDAWNRYKDIFSDDEVFKAVFELMGTEQNITDEVRNILEEQAVQEGRALVSIKVHDSERALILEEILGKEDFEKYKVQYMTNIAKDEKYLKKIVKDGFFTMDDFIQTLGYKNLYEAVKQGSKYLNKYLDKENLIKSYKEGYATKDDLLRLNVMEYITDDDILLSKEDLFYLMEKSKARSYKQEDRDRILNLLDKLNLNDKEVNQLASSNFISIEDIITRFEEERARKIRVELIPYTISDKTMVNIMTPNTIFSIINNKRSSEEAKSFVRNNLRQLYKDQGLDFDKILIEAKEQEAKEKSLKKADYLYLYKTGLVGLNSFDEGQISESDIEEFYKTTEDNKVLVDAYNCGLCEAEDILIYLDEKQDKLLELIKNEGLNPSILTEFYSTYEILSMYNEDLISSDNLLCVKDTMNIEDIQNLYVSKKLALDMLEDLVDIGFISEEQSEEIQSAYDMKADYEKLLEKGKVIGFFGEETYAPKVEPQKKVTRVSRGKSHKLQDKIGKETRHKLFMMLGADEKVLPVEGDIWERAEGNELYTILDKKIAYIEPKNGRELTFAMPLRVVLEYATGDDSIISKAKKKKDLTKNPVVKSYKHSAQWGLKTVEAAAQIDEDFAKTKPTKNPEFKKIINEISDNYKIAAELEKQ